MSLLVDVVILSCIKYKLIIADITFSIYNYTQTTTTFIKYFYVTRQYITRAHHSVQQWTNRRRRRLPTRHQWTK